MNKSFSRVILLLSIFSLFSCQNFDLSKFKKSDVNPTALASQAENQTTIIDKGISHDQFQSQNLVTATQVKTKIKVALFLPLSGRNKELGIHLSNAGILSLFENDINHNIELVLVDCKDSPQDAIKAFQQIIDDKIKIVVGPVFSSSIEPIKDLAKKHEITIFSFSNNHQLIGNTNDNGGVFLSGLMLESQIDKIVSYSMRNGRKNFAVIAPNNQFGHTVTDILKDTVLDRDGNFTASEIYEFNERGLEKSVERVVNSFTVASHLAEGGGGKAKKTKNMVINEKDRAYVQAILVPESGKILSKIAQLIKETNKTERDIKLIGTNQWDELSTLNDDNLIGSWFPAPKTDKFRSFEKRYYQSYNKFPPRISSISYDLINMIVKLSDKKQPGEEIKFYDFISGDLIKHGFDGIDGMFRFLPNGYVQRNLAILEVGNGVFKVAEEPAKIFLQY